MSMSPLRYMAVIGCIAAGVIAPGPSFAAGGIYLDNVLCKCDGATVVSTGFDSGLDGWKLLTDASITPAGKPFPSATLHVNRHAATRAGAGRDVTIRDARVVELHAWIYLPKVTEQADYRRRVAGFAYLGVWSKTMTQNIYFGPKLYEKDDGYRIGVLWNSGTGTPPEAATEKAVLKPETWALLSLYLDLAAGTASVYLDHKPQVSLEIAPQAFAWIDFIGIQSWLGDGVDLPEKAP